MIDQGHTRKIPNILVTGTPGTGKTTLCQLLNQSLKFVYVPVGQLIKQQQLYTTWNKQFDVPEFDEQKLIAYIQHNFQMNNGGLLFDFHSPDVFPQHYFDLIVLMRCQNQTLYRRLSQRHYQAQKITQNIECQIFDQVKLDLADIYGENNPKILQLRNEKQNQMETNLECVINWLMQYKKSQQSNLMTQ